jgi:hypothetical protein
LSFTTAKLEPSSNRFVLVRLNPARYFSGSLSLNGSNYEGTFTGVISHVQRNGTSLTKVSTLSGNDQWKHDETTGLLQVRLASAPNSTTNVIVVFYYLFYTSSPAGAVAYQTPSDSGTTLRNWSTGIKQIPTARESFSNLLTGATFTMADTSLEVTADATLRGYLTSNDSFNNKAVDIWLCIDSTDNIQQIYQGKMKSLSLSATSLSISCFDAFAPLAQPALMGDSLSVAYYLRKTGSYPSMRPEDHGKPCRYILGKHSRHTNEQITTMASVAGYKTLSGEPAVCTNWSSSASTTTNRTWGLCRLANIATAQPTGAVQAETTNGNDLFLRYASHSYSPGDTFIWSSAGVYWYGLVERTTSFTYSATSYNLSVRVEGFGWPTVASSVISVPYSMAMVIKRGDDPTASLIRPIYLRDYTASVLTTAAGNKVVSVTFNNNFEATVEGGSGWTLDPSRDQVMFRVTQSSGILHGDVLSTICQKAGLTVASSTFTQANTDLAVNAQFSIPYTGETGYSHYTQYVQDLLASTLGYLRMNTSQQVEYKLLAAPSSTDSVDKFEYLGGVSAEIDCQDVVTSIVASNPHNVSVEVLDAATSPTEIVESTKARYLHGVQNEINFTHLLETITGRISAILAVRSSRKVLYRLGVPTKFLDAVLGQDFLLTSAELPGGGSSKALKITSIERDVNSVTIEATDVEGL